MNKTLKHYFILGALVVSALGTLAHFAYEWSGSNRLVALFTAVNESTWEHMKLLFFPMLLVSGILYLLLKENYPNILCGLLGGNLVGLALIPILFYTYSGILGKNISAINISIFYISVLAAFITAYLITLKGKKEQCSNLLLFVTFILVLLFFIFTYYPPSLGIFTPPDYMPPSD